MKKIFLMIFFFPIFGVFYMVSCGTDTSSKSEISDLDISEDIFIENDKYISEFENWIQEQSEDDIFSFDGFDIIEGGFLSPCSENSDCETGLCVDSESGPVCTIPCYGTECPKGFQCIGVAGMTDVMFLCMPISKKICLQCTSDVQCGVNKCRELADSKYCLPTCEHHENCPKGFFCDQYCIPESLACDCLEKDIGVKKMCSIKNDHGECYGFSTCNPATGWSICEAKTPAQEICDEIDNNCNGIPDKDIPGFGDKCSILIPEVGECYGTKICAEGKQTLQCTANTPEIEQCNYIDDNCNNKTDEDWPDLGKSCKTGMGICERKGYKICDPENSLGNSICNVAPGTGNITEICDYQDDNCNGLIDENFTDINGKYYKVTDCAACNNNCSNYWIPDTSYYHVNPVCNSSTVIPFCDFTCAEGYVDADLIEDNGCELLADLEAIYVSTPANGGLDNSNCGLWNYPCATIGYGLSRAEISSKKKVLVSAGAYYGSVTLKNGIDLLGGYNPENWARDFKVNLTVIHGNTETEHKKTIIGHEIKLSTVFEGFVVYGENTYESSRNTYSIYLKNCNSNLQIKNNEIWAGNGGAGNNGTDGNPGSSGENGKDGDHTFTSISCACNIGSGNSGIAGDGGLRLCSNVDVSGGDGAGAACPYGNNPQGSGTYGKTASGNGTAGAGGSGGYDRYSKDCGTFDSGGKSANGIYGKDGGHGDHGNGGIGSYFNNGQVNDDFEWSGYEGSEGSNGKHGGGGGGGGAGGGADIQGVTDPTGKFYSCGNCLYGEGFDCCQWDITLNTEDDALGGSGGGGGSGGCSGSGGKGGKAGGGSFGIFMVFSSASSNYPGLKNNIIHRGNGGAGGSGGNAGAGGIGGNGGNGGKVKGYFAFAMGDGGRGGQGGNGGSGGGGGGGSGGVSYGIYVYNNTTKPDYESQNTFISGGNPGNGGTGGTSMGKYGTAGTSGGSGNTSLK